MEKSVQRIQNKKKFEGLANKGMEEIQDLSKQIDFNNLTYHYKGNTVRKAFIGFKGPLGFYKNIKEGYIKIRKAEEKQKVFKSKINEIVRGSKKSEDQKNAIKKH